MGASGAPGCSRDNTGALAAVALAGLKTRHYNLRAWKARRYGCAARGVRHWRPSTNMNEHKEERSLERLLDMEVSRKKIRFWDFWAVSRRRDETHFRTRIVYYSDDYRVNTNFGRGSVSDNPTIGTLGPYLRMSSVSANMSISSNFTKHR